MGKMNWNRVRRENQVAKWREDNPHEYRVQRDARQAGVPTDPSPRWGDDVSSESTAKSKTSKKTKGGPLSPERALCPDCGAVVSAKKFEKHRLKTCPKRLVKCPRCQLAIPVKSLQTHLREHDLRRLAGIAPPRSQEAVLVARRSKCCPVCRSRIPNFDPDGYNECEVCLTEFRLGPL